MIWNTWYTGQGMLKVDERTLLGNSEIFNGTLKAALLWNTRVSLVPKSVHFSSIYFAQALYIWQLVSHKAWHINQNTY